jgi:hypothetical protein
VSCERSTGSGSDYFFHSICARFSDESSVSIALSRSALSACLRNVSNLFFGHILGTRYFHTRNSENLTNAVNVDFATFLS